MSEFQKVQILAEIKLLDSDQIMAGYWHGFDNGKEPGSDKCRSFWHGWRNGMCDGGHAELDESQRRLAAEFSVSSGVQLNAH